MKQKILVIDDDPDVRKLVRINLTSSGFQVLEAGEGQQGIELARQHQPSLVLLDLMMPVMDGWTVLKELESDAATAGLPIVILTALAHDEHVLMGMEAGAVEHLCKPFDLAGLNRCVTTTLERAVSRRREDYRHGLIEKRRSFIQLRQA